MRHTSLLHILGRAVLIYMHKTFALTRYINWFEYKHVILLVLMSMISFRTCMSSLLHEAAHVCGHVDTG